MQNQERGTGAEDVKNEDFAIVKFADMDERMQQHAVDCAAHAFKLKSIEADIATFIKSEFDIMYNPQWHCITDCPGRSFGSYVTHQTKHFIYFFYKQIGILLWKSEAEKPDGDDQ